MPTKASGYSETITYVKQQGSTWEGQCKWTAHERTITWYNPPSQQRCKNQNLKTFLCLVTKHFPSGSKVHKIFNWGTVKISYSCTTNMAMLIKCHNSCICNPAVMDDPMTERCCNCRGGKVTCPLRGECLIEGHGLQDNRYRGGPSRVLSSDNCCANTIYVKAACTLSFA